MKGDASLCMFTVLINKKKRHWSAQKYSVSYCCLCTLLGYTLNLTCSTSIKNDSNETTDFSWGLGIGESFIHPGPDTDQQNVSVWSINIPVHFILPITSLILNAAH